MILLHSPLIYGFSGTLLLLIGHGQKRRKATAGGQCRASADDTFFTARGIPDRLLQTDLTKGLGDDDVLERRGIWGRNEAPGSSRSFACLRQEPGKPEHYV